MELWKECLASSVTQSRITFRPSNKQHLSWPKSRSRVWLAWRVGSLRFKTAWRLYNTRRGLGTKCIMPMCGHEDTLDHMKQCKFYETKWDDKWVEDEDIARYLEKANRERFIKAKMPLI